MEPEVAKQEYLDQAVAVVTEMFDHVCYGRRPVRARFKAAYQTLNSEPLLYRDLKAFEQHLNQLYPNFVSPTFSLHDTNDGFVTIEFSAFAPETSPGFNQQIGGVSDK